MRNPGEQLDPNSDGSSGHPPSRIPDWSPWLRLKTHLEKEGADQTAAESFVWLLNLHPRLPGLVQCCTHIQDVLGRIDPRPKWADGWAPILSIVQRDPVELAANLFDEETDRHRCLQTDGRNPLLGNGAKRHSLHRLLWESPETSADLAKFRALQSQFVMAYSEIMRSNTNYRMWVEGREPYDGYYQSLYDATRHALRLLKSGSLGRLPESMNANSYAERLKGTVRELPAYPLSGLIDEDNAARQTAECFNAIASFIEWGLHPERHNHFKRIRDGRAQQSDEHSGSTGGGEGEPAAKRGVGWHERKSSGSGSVDRVIARHTRWRKSPKLERALRDAGDHPGEALASNAVDLVKDAAGVSLAQAGWAEMQNQLLPWAFNELSIEEVARAWTAFHAAAGANDQDALECVIFLHATLWTGRPADDVTLLQVVKGAAAPPNESGVRFLLKGHVPDEPGGSWEVRALAPSYKTAVEETQHERHLVDHFQLPDESGTARLLLRLFALRGEIGDGRVFSRDRAWYERKIAKQLHTIDSSRRITLSRIRNVLFQHIVDLRGRDVVTASLITGRDHHLASVRRYYAAPTVQFLQEVYTQAASSLRKQLEACGCEHMLGSPVILEPTQHAVGGRWCPTQDAVRGAIQELRNTICPGLVTADFRRFHNLYTLYTLLYFGFAIGIRGITNPYLDPSQVDASTGIAVISDKDSGSGYKARLIWIPPGVLKQMEEYTRLLDSTIFEQFGLPKIDRHRPCYFIGERKGLHWQACKATPTRIMRHLSEFLTLPANFARHFNCTEWLEGGFMAAWIDAWMGHWWRGEEPWQPYSCFSYRKYRNELESRVPAFLAGLGFEPINLSGEVVR